MSIEVSPGAPPQGGGAVRRAKEPAPQVDAIAPIIAGARARGIADAFEMMGEGAVLVDFAGAVLHVGAIARPMMGAAIIVTQGQIAAASRKAAEPLEALLQAGLGEGAPRVLEADLLCEEEGMRQRIRLLRALGDDTYQLLAAVLVLEPPRRVRSRRLRRERPFSGATG